MKFCLLPVQFMLGQGIKNEKISDKTSLKKKDKTFPTTADRN